MGNWYDRVELTSAERAHLGEIRYRQFMAYEITAPDYRQFLQVELGFNAHAAEQEFVAAKAERERTALEWWTNFGGYTARGRRAFHSGEPGSSVGERNR